MEETGAAYFEVAVEVPVQVDTVPHAAFLRMGIMAVCLGKPGDRQGCHIVHAVDRSRDLIQQHDAHDQHQQDQNKAFPTHLGYSHPIWRAAVLGKPLLQLFCLTGFLLLRHSESPGLDVGGSVSIALAVSVVNAHENSSLATAIKNSSPANLF